MLKVHRVEEQLRKSSDFMINWQVNTEMVLGLVDFYGYVGKRVDEFEGVLGGNGFGEKNVKENVARFLR